MNRINSFKILETRKRTYENSVKRTDELLKRIAKEHPEIKKQVQHIEKNSARDSNKNLEKV